MTAIAISAATESLDSAAPFLHALRVDLAAAFRLMVNLDWHESVGNHLSVAVSADGHQFLVNPKWRHFSLIRASDLLLVDSNDPATLSRPDAFTANCTGWYPTRVACCMCTRPTPRRWLPCRIRGCCP
jgi:Class II Aldolase and Adducin N-terminal domain